MKVKRVIVGLDDSEVAAAAARWAAEAVRDSGGEVVAVHSTEGFSLVRQATEAAGRGLGMFSSGVAAPTDEEVGALVEGWCGAFSEAGVPYRTVLAHGDPVDGLLDTARREDADLIVIGHQGDTGFIHRLFRGVSDQLVHHARRPVVVVPFWRPSK